MSTPATGPMRLARAGVLTAVTMGLSATAHQAAGGALPGLLVIALLSEAVWAAAYVCAQWRLSLPVLILLLSAGQLLLHKAFMALALPASMSAPSSSALPHAHGTWPAVDVGAGRAGESSTMAMTLAHVAVTLALVVVLATGEQALWRLWCWLTPMVLRVSALVPPLISWAAPFRALAPSRALVLRLLAADPRRGPPLLTAR